MAAGFGSRMVPVTLDTPKPLVKVNGTRFIETLIEAFLQKGINDIYIIRGYKKEAFNELLDKYPFIKFIDNDDYDKGNNILSVEKALPYISDTFFAEADLFLTNPDLIDTSSKSSYYLARPVSNTEDWCFDINEEGYLTNYRKGGENCLVACGLSYWNEDDCIKIKKYLIEALKDDKNKDIFWEFIPFVNYCHHFKVRGQNYNSSDIVEIDSFQELCDIDPSYKDYKGVK